VFYAQLLKACDCKGVKLTPLLKEMGISTGNTGSWKKGGMPSVEVLDSLSLRLDVSVDFLLGKTYDPTPAHKKNASLSPKGTKEALRLHLIEAGIISDDRPVTDEEWDAIISFAEAFLKRRDT
jgi:transcriptional regulator with XRE-family HTH domain